MGILFLEHCIQYWGSFNDTFDTMPDCDKETDRQTDRQQTDGKQTSFESKHRAYT